MLKARKQTASIIQRTVIAHVTPYSAGDMVISCIVSLAWSEGGPLPLKKTKTKTYLTIIPRARALDMR